MENNIHSDELQHHGTKGMKWGRRLYQNKDGSLTALGQKRYNKEVAKLKKETAKVKEAEKVAATRKKTQTKLDKLEADKQKLEARKKALKGDSKSKQDDDPNEGETPEQRKERILKSTDAKEVYENRHLLSDQELMNRVNRIDLEMRLNSKVPAEAPKKTGLDRMDDAKNVIDKSTALYKSVDNAYSSVANSAIGKTLAKTLGIEPPKKTYDYNIDNFLKDIKNKSPKEINEFNQAQNNIDKLKNRTKQSQKEAEKQAEKEAKKQAKKEAKKAAKEAEKQAKKNDSEEPEIIDATDTSKKTANNSSKKQNEDISDYVSWQDENGKGATATKNAVAKSTSTKLSDVDYKNYAKDIKEWREKYDREDSSYSHQQTLDALYDIEKKYGISFRNL